MNQLLFNTDIVLSNFSFSKPGLTDTHFHAFIASSEYVYKVMGNDGDAWLKLRDVAGYVIYKSII